MLGIMAFVAEQKIPGSVPALGSLGLKPYANPEPHPYPNPDPNPHPYPDPDPDPAPHQVRGRGHGSLRRRQLRPAVRVGDAGLHLAVVG